VASTVLSIVAAAILKSVESSFKAQRSQEILQARQEIKQNVRRAVSGFSISATAADLARNPRFRDCTNGGNSGFACEENKKFGLTITRGGKSAVVVAGPPHAPARYRASGAPCAPGELPSKKCPLEVVATFSSECDGRSFCAGRVTQFQYDCEVRGAPEVDFSHFGFQKLAPALCSVEDLSEPKQPAKAHAVPDPAMVPGDLYRNACDLCKSSTFRNACNERRVEGGAVFDIQASSIILVSEQAFL
jgi:hypothetical protein